MSRIKMKWLIGGTVLVCACFAGGVWWWDSVPSAPSEAAPGKTAASRPTASRSAAAHAENTSSASAKAGSTKSGPANSGQAGPGQADLTIPELPSGGNLGSLTIRRAQLSETKLQADIEEQNARLRKAQSAALPAPVIVSGSGKIPEPDLILPDLSKPLSSSGISSRGASAQPDYVVGVQGVDGKLTATIRSKGKLVTLRPGQSYAGGVVSAISREAVSVKQPGGSSRNLPFE